MHTGTGDGCNVGSKNVTLLEKQQWLQGPKNKKLRLRKIGTKAGTMPEIGNRGSTLFYVSYLRPPSVIHVSWETKASNTCQRKYSKAGRKSHTKCAIGEFWSRKLALLLLVGHDVLFKSLPLVIRQAKIILSDGTIKLPSWIHEGGSFLEASAAGELWCKL